MKKLILLLAIAIAAILFWNGYQQNKRFQPPSEYDYPVSDKIDVNYHDQQLLRDYYAGALEAGQFARNQWFAHKVDVRFSDQDSEEVAFAVKTYEQMIKTLMEQEGRLEESLRLKNLGLKNSDIILIEEKGYSPEDFKIWKSMNQIAISPLQRGSKGPEVWEMQKILLSFNIPLNHDGIFDQETESALKSFQEIIGAYPSGKFDSYTVNKYNEFLLSGIED